jgi:hypothetical protein
MEWCSDLELGFGLHSKELGNQGGDRTEFINLNSLNPHS